MPDRLVDVLNARNTVLGVIPVVVDGPDGDQADAPCIEAALKVAADLHFVADEEMDGLHARPHVSRGGQLAPVGDALQIRQAAWHRADEDVRTRAYFLWQQASCPENMADDHWRRASETEHTAHRAG